MVRGIYSLIIIFINIRDFGRFGNIGHRASFPTQAWDALDNEGT